MILINGEFEQKISVLDRGLQYGDGIFETLAVINGEVRHWPKHWQRFSNACQRMYLPVPDEQTLISEVRQLSFDKSKAVVKILYTRGLGDRGYAFGDINATRIVMDFSWPKYSPENGSSGIEMYLCQTRLGRQHQLAGIKHLNRLENVLARHEWSDNKFAEGLLLDTENCVIEGTMSNIFLVSDKSLITPALTHCGVLGITRQRVLELAESQNLSVFEKTVTLNDVYSADEMFACNSLIGVWPVKKIGNKIFQQIGDDDSITSRLQKDINH